MIILYSDIISHRGYIQMEVYKMDRHVDARGLSCPKPVIETKKILDQLKDGSVTTIVDNKIAMENVSKLAKSMDCQVNIEEIEGNYYIHIYKDAEGSEVIPESKLKKDMAILIGSDTMGEGSKELGQVLMKGFMYTLAEDKPYPKAILFINSGVKLTTEGSEVLEYLRILEAEGVDILSCGTCLDYYNLKNKLLVGGVTNMYTIVEKISKVKNTIRI